MNFGANTSFGFSSSGGGGGGTITSANNGNSVSSTSSAIIVWGQDVGQAGSPAKLLSNREIPMNAFAMSFLGSNMNLSIQADGSLLVGGPASGNAVVFWSGRPNNFGTAYPGHGVAEGFSSGWQRFDGVNTYPRPNVVGQWWAYNYSTGGSTIEPTEAGFGYRTETDFDLNEGGEDFFELHQPELAAPSGLTIRANSYYVSKTTLSLITQQQTQNVNYNTKNENETYYGWSATTSGGPPDTQRTVALTVTAKGTNALITQSFNDLTAIYAPAFFNWDRGSIVWGLDDTGTSINNKLIQVFGNIRQRGTLDSGVSFIQTFSQSDRPTELAVQMFADTFNNNPSVIFDRRLANGDGAIGNGNNGGEITWAGGRNLNISAIANGMFLLNQLYDLNISAIDTDGLLHTNLLVGRNGNSTFRGSITTGDPGGGAGAWELGTLITAAVTPDTTRYLQVNVAGTIYKVIIST